STNQGNTFKSKVLGPWKLNTCPMSTMALGQGLGDTLVAMWETEGQVYYASINPERLETDAPGLGPEGSNRERKHPAFAVSSTPGPGMLLAWTEGTKWAKGGSLAYEYIDVAHGEKHPRSEEGVPAWSRIAAVTEADGSFTIVY